MLHSDLLLTFAEIAVAFAGFASLISLLGQSSEVLDSSRLLGMVRTSLLVTAFSLLPFVPAALGSSPLAAWRLSGAVFFVVAGLHTFLAWRQLYRLWKRGVWKVRAGYYTFPAGGTSLALALCAALAPEERISAGLYISSLAALLSVSGVLFLGVFTSFVRARRGGSAGGPA